jgi:hypothetical protein
MFRSNADEFLLCYDEFGLYVDRHGDPSRSVAVVEWEGTAERAAHHPPYVLLFDSRFIEVRDVETGRLVQIIPGNDVRCIWDGRGARIPPMPTPGAEAWGENQYDQEARVHAVMNAPDPAPPQPGMPRQTRAAVQAQQVVELIPTIPLFLPGSLNRYENPFLNCPVNVLTNMSAPANRHISRTTGTHLHRALDIRLRHRRTGADEWIIHFRFPFVQIYLDQISYLPIHRMMMCCTALDCYEILSERCLMYVC